VIDEFVQKFASARSILAPFKRHKSARFAYSRIHQARERDLKRLQISLGLIQRTTDLKLDSYIHNLLTRFSNSCPTEIIDLLRSYCWKKPLIGVTYPCPVDQIHITPYDQQYFDLEELPETFTIWVFPFEGNRNACYEHGHNEMYLRKHTDLNIFPPNLSIS
jgi:hypothetical protein